MPCYLSGAQRRHWTRGKCGVLCFWKLPSYQMDMCFLSVRDGGGENSVCKMSCIL